MPFGGALTAVVGAVASSALSDSNSGSSTQQASTLSEYQQLALNTLVHDYLQTQLGDITKQQPAYTDPFAAPLTNLQKMSLSSIEQLSQNMANSSSYQAGTDALKRGLSGTGQDITDTFQKSIVDPLTKQFTERTVPGLIGNFAGNAAYGSDKQKAQLMALEDLSKNISSAGANLAYQSGNAAADRQIQALGQLPNVLNTPLNAAISALNAGGIAQQTQQTQLTGQYQNFLSEQTQRNELLKALLAAVGTPSMENITTVGSGSDNGLGSLVGGLLKGSGSIGSGSNDLSNLFSSIVNSTKPVGLTSFYSGQL